MQIRQIIMVMAHTCMDAHGYTHAHMHTCTHAHMHTCTHAHMHTCTHAHMHTCTHAHMQTHIHMHGRTLLHTCTHTHAYTHTTHAHTKTHTYITLWVQKAPATILEESFGVIIDCLHNLGPVQTLHPLRVLDITGANGRQIAQKLANGLLWLFLKLHVYM